MDGIASSRLADERSKRYKREPFWPQNCVSPTLCSLARKEESVRLVLIDRKMLPQKKKKKYIEICVR